MAGAPYVPARKDRIKTVIQLIQPQAGDRIVDLGSGDGRVVRELAKSGATVDGYEIQLLLVLWSKFISRIQQIKTTRFFRQNLFNVNLQNYDAVVIYALPNMMQSLRQKFESELQPGAHVASIAFPIPGWKHIKKQNDVYLYQIGKTSDSST